MPDVEARLRDMLAGRAALMPDTAGDVRSVVARVERRRRRRAVTLAAGAAVFVALLGAGVVRDRLADSTAVVAGLGGSKEGPGTGPPASPRPDPGGAGQTPEVLVFAGLDLVDVSTSPPSKLAELPASGAVEGVPVRTPAGVVALVADQDRSTLWLVPTGGEPAVRLADGVSGFAVAPAGRTIAWSRLSSSSTPNPVTELVELRLPGEVAHRAKVRGFARVVGYAGDAVLADTGDGAAASVAIWVPGADSAVAAVAPDGARFGSVSATDARRRRAILNQGDGPCGALVAVEVSGRVLPLGDERVAEAACHGDLRSFSPNGGLFAAGVQKVPTEAEPVGVHSTDDGGTRGRFGLEGNLLQLVWSDDDTVVVLTQRSRSLDNVVWSCRLGEAVCERAWSTPRPVRLVAPTPR